MWIANGEGTVVANSDNIAYVFIARCKENIVIRAHLCDGGRVTLRKLPKDNEAGARFEFKQIRDMLERDNQRRWRY